MPSPGDDEPTDARSESTDLPPESTGRPAQPTDVPSESTGVAPHPAHVPPDPADGRLEARDPAGSRRSRLAKIVLGLALAAAVLGALSGFGSRWGIWGFRTGFSLLEWSAYAAIVTAVLSLPVLWMTRPSQGRPIRSFLTALLALIVSLPVFGLPLTWRIRAGEVPRIHDITTDTDDPPAFVEIAPLRADAPNPVEYPGPEVAVQQRQAYPDIRPVILDQPVTEVYERALAAARASGWEIVGSNLEEGRIEATDRTFWFGFRDDIVIRLTPNGNRTIVDVRSKSRVGGSDAGTNARRIRSYLERLTGPR